MKYLRISCIAFFILSLFSQAETPDAEGTHTIGASNPDGATLHFEKGTYKVTYVSGHNQWTGASNNDTPYAGYMALRTPQQATTGFEILFWGNNRYSSSSEVESVHIGLTATFTISEAGTYHLYFPDGPSDYGDNSGEVVLKVTGEGCSACEGGTCDASNNSNSGLEGGQQVNTFDSGSGNAQLVFKNPATDDFGSRESLIYFTRDILGEERINSDGLLKQAKNEKYLTQIDTIDANSYSIKRYPVSQVGSKVDGLYTVTGNPESEMVFTKSTTNPKSLTVEEKSNNTLKKRTNFTYDVTNSLWTMGQDLDGNGTIDKYEYETKSTSGSNTVRTSFILNGDQTVASKIQRTYDADENLIEEIVDPDGVALTTTYTYTNGNLTRTDNPDGSWETSTYTANNLQELVTRSSGLFTKYEYDANNRITKIIESFNGSTYTTNENDHKVTLYNYSPVYSGDDGSVEVDSVRTITVKILGQNISKTYYGYLANESHIIQAATPIAGINNANNLVSSTYTNSEGEVTKIVEADGRGSIISSETVGTTVTTTTKSGVFNTAFDAIVEGTENVETVTDDLLVLTETYDIASGLLISSRSVTERDSANREKRVDYHDGTYEMFIYGCCNLDSTRSREGIWTDYTYDSLGRQLTSKTNGVIEISTYDAVGNVVKREQQGTDGTVRTLSESHYDFAGRLEWTKDALGFQTTFSESYANGQTTSTKTYPNNTTEITVTDSEGRLVSISGTAVFPQSAALDEERLVLDSDLGYHVHVQRSGEANNWVDSFTDALGRSYKSVDNNGGTAKQFYAAGTGELAKSVNSSGAVSLYYNDPANNLSIEALDVNKNGTIDYGVDTITRTQSDWYENASNIVYQRTRTWINPDSFANPGAADNINEVSSDGLARVNTSITNGITSTFEMQTVVTVDEEENSIITSTATRPDGSYTETKLINGFQDYEKSFDSNDNLLHEVSFTYDKFNRLWTQNDSRNGLTTYSYDLTDKVLTLTTADPDGAGPKTAQVFTNKYNNMGRRDWVENPDGTKINFEYTTQGLIWKSYGANVYPREYVYDNDGQLQKIKTWKNYAAKTGENEVAWTYNAQGQLETERDKFGRETTYTYYPESGLLHTKTSPRNITKTYTYDSSGRIDTISYSDNTPSISFTYNALGQIDTITDEAGTRTLKYNDLGQYKGVVWTGGIFNGVETTYNYDNIGRQDSFVRTINGAQKVFSYDYDNYGRLSKVTKGEYSFEYSYLDNAPNTVEKMTVRKGTAAQMHSKREFDKIMRTTKFTWSTGAGE